MRKILSYSTTDQMIEAFESKILELEGSDVASSTATEGSSISSNPYGIADVKKYLNGKLEFYGGEIEMDFGDGLKLANYLKRKGKQVNYCPSQETWSIPGECHWGDCYFYPYEANLDGCDDDMIWDGQSYPIDSATKVRAPHALPESADLKSVISQLISCVGSRLRESHAYVCNLGDSDSICIFESSDTGDLCAFRVDSNIDVICGTDEIVSYVCNTFGEDNKQRDVSSSSRVVASGEDSHIISETFEQFVQSQIEEGNADSAEEIAEVWWGVAPESVKMVYYPADEEVPYLAFEQNDGTLVLVGDGDIAESSWEEIQEVFKSSDVIGSTDVSDEDYEYENEPESQFTEIASKQVQDSDGFLTDYTMYRDIETGEYVFVFGDKDIYTPELGDFDWSCDTEEEAWEWYNSYNGFDDEDGIYSSTKVVASEELTPEGFYEFFSVSAEPELMDKAAKILYEWYSNEGEEYMPEYVDILDMCDAADDETEKRIVLEAIGEETYDRDDEDVDASCNCKVEGMTQNKVSCATIADNGKQVFQLMEYDSDPESGIEGDDFYCYGEFFATDEDDALKQLEEAKSTYPEFANLSDQVQLFVQPYNEHFSTGKEIYQNVSAIAQHINPDLNDEDITGADNVQAGYVYRLCHGYGPGTLPKGVNVLDHTEDGYCDIVELDRKLTEEEMDYYDIESC